MEAGGGDETLHHGIVRQRDRDREWESKRKSDDRENEKKKKNVYFLFFLLTVLLIFFNYKKKEKKKKESQNDVVLAHLTAIDNWDLTEYRINNNWKLED